MRLVRRGDDVRLVMATGADHTDAMRTPSCGMTRVKLDTASRQELLGTIEDYRTGLLPLIVPMTLMTHHVRRLGVAKALMLRNHT